MSKEKIISIRLYEDMLEALDEYASSEKKGRTQIIREAITNYLGLPKEPLEEKVDILEERVNSIEDKNEAIEKEVELMREKLDSESKKSIALREEVRELKSLVFELVRKKNS
ncbi:hypothetical protein CAL7716_057760 [Calothrix sp. PCC 7716]|nr:hypothetical protein CAL7716_057760 [Calothrix sp. PCC 7716]